MKHGHTYRCTRCKVEARKWWTAITYACIDERCGGVMRRINLQYEMADAKAKRELLEMNT